MSAQRERSIDAPVRTLCKAAEAADKCDVPAEVKESIEKTFEVIEAKKEYCRTNTFQDTPNARMIVEKTYATPWKELHEQGKVGTLYGSTWMSGKGQGQLMQFLARMQKARRFLEIGMFTGYVAMAMAEVLPEDGKVVTCEMEPYLVESGRKSFDETPFGKKIDIRQGPALETLKQLASEGQQFDLVYVDADKAGYLDYFKTMLDKNLLAVGGTLVIDNAFEFGFAYTTEGSQVDAFNKAVMADDRVEQVMLPVFDGVSLIRRKGE